MYFYSILSISVWSLLGLKEQFLFSLASEQPACFHIGHFNFMCFDFMLRNLVFPGNPPLTFSLCSTTVCESLLALPRKNDYRMQTCGRINSEFFFNVIYEKFQTCNNIERNIQWIAVYILLLSLIFYSTCFIICSFVFYLFIFSFS